MTVLYIDEPGTVVGRRGDQIVVTCKRGEPSRLPVAQVGRLVVRGGGVHVTPSALSLLASRAIDVAYLRRSGELLGRFAAPVRRDGAIRQRQWDAVRSPEHRLRIAADIIRGKLLNQAALIERRGRKEDAGDIRRLADAIDAVRTLDALRGVEGAAARRYFASWRTFLPDELAFRGRVYHPPTDAMNAALSFAYTCLLHDGLAACEAAGLDAGVGFLHEAGPAKPALALDLIEELRPLVADSIVLELAGRRRIRVDGRSGEVRLTPVARMDLLAAYEHRMARKRQSWDGQRTTYRRCVVRQAEQLTRVLVATQSRYRPLAWS